MDARTLRLASGWPLAAGWLAGLLLGAGTPARAQAPSSAAGTGQPRRAAPTGESRPGAKAAGDQADAKNKDRAKAQAPRREPSAEYQAEIRKTVERRRQRRARRAQAQGPDDSRPVGAIVPWPMPPALIIRQTPQMHDEVGSLLDKLRRSR